MWRRMYVFMGGIGRIVKLAKKAKYSDVTLYVGCFWFFILDIPHYNI